MSDLFVRSILRIYLYEINNKSYNRWIYLRIHSFNRFLQIFQISFGNIYIYIYIYIYMCVCVCVCVCVCFLSIPRYTYITNFRIYYSFHRNVFLMCCGKINPPYNTTLVECIKIIVLSCLINTHTHTYDIYIYIYFSIWNQRY